MRVVVASTIVGILLLGGCGGDDSGGPGTSAADCTNQVRYDGRSTLEAD